MCGLIAYYKSSDHPLDPRLIAEMTHALAHRGPDDYGLCFATVERTLFWRKGDNLMPFTQKGVGMGHRRLSVFDLTTAGRQPFCSTDRRFTMVFNGEIYNFVELRKELSQYGYRFLTDCDTEVLLAAFEKWGVDCFNRLNGVWAVVIWDNRSRDLIVARDRLGQKPLLYVQVDGDWIFASEVKALLRHPRIAVEPNEQVLLYYIANDKGPWGEETFFSGIRSVEPGTYVTLNDGRVTKKTKYWSLVTKAGFTRSDEKVAAEELDDLLTDAVRLRLRGDIRVAAMLSGGLDSTSVISSIRSILATRPSEGRTIGDRLQAFTACFPGMEIDETEKVEEICHSFEITAHKVFPCDAENIEERLKEVAWSAEEPFWLPVMIVHDMLMKLARSSDTQVVLDGIGGDELFAGFVRYIPIVVRDGLHRLHIRDAISNFQGMCRKHDRNVLKEGLRVVAPNSIRYRVQNLVGQLRGVPSHRYSRLFRAALQDRHGYYPRLEDATDLGSAQKWDLLQNYTPRWLHMSDRISMFNSVVSRSPFLDFRLVEFAFALDDSLKIRNGETKYIVREAKRRQLPPRIVGDSRKVGFSGPHSLWLRGPLKELALSLRDPKRSRISSFLRRDVLSNIIDDFYQDSRANVHPLSHILNAEAWLRAYF